MDFLLDILGSNINYGSLITLILVYILLIWVMLCLWVLIDSKKRYKNTWVAVGLFFLVLILNLPALVFYLVIRPEKEDDNVLYLQSDEPSVSAGGVNVPIVNFTGQDGFVISLQLKVANVKPQSETNDNNMNINVEFNSVNESMQVVKTDQSIKVTTSEPSGTKTLVIPKFKSHAINAANRLKSASLKVVGGVQTYAKNIEVEDAKPAKEVEQKINKKSNKKNHQNKKDKRKK